MRARQWQWEGEGWCRKRVQGRKQGHCATHCRPPEHFHSASGGVAPAAVSLGWGASSSRGSLRVWYPRPPAVQHSYSNPPASIDPRAGYLLGSLLGLACLLGPAAQALGRVAFWCCKAVDEEGYGRCPQLYRSSVSSSACLHPVRAFCSLRLRKGTEIEWPEVQRYLMLDPSCVRLHGGGMDGLASHG